MFRFTLFDISFMKSEKSVNVLGIQGRSLLFICFMQLNNGKFQPVYIDLFFLRLFNLFEEVVK